MNINSPLKSLSDRSEAFCKFQEAANEMSKAICRIQDASNKLSMGIG